MPETKTFLERINTRNIIAITFVVGYFGFLFYSVEKNLIEENPVLTIMLGIMSAGLMLIVQFYFRRAEPQ